MAGGIKNDISEGRSNIGTMLATLVAPDGVTALQDRAAAGRTRLVQGAMARQLDDLTAVGSPEYRDYSQVLQTGKAPVTQAAQPLMDRRGAERALQVGAPDEFNAAKIGAAIKTLFPPAPSKEDFIGTPGEGGVFNWRTGQMQPGTQYGKRPEGLGPDGKPLPGYIDFQSAVAAAKLTPLERQLKESEIRKNQTTADMQADSVLTPDSAQQIAEQLVAGDTSGMQGLGYGNVGAKNRSMVRNAFTTLAKARNLSGEDIAAINAEYFGTKAGERTLGTRSANIDMAVNEASNMGKLVRDASTKVPRGAWMPINKAMQAWNEGTGSPESRAFGASVNSFLNAYATAVGKGTMTVDARNHAQELLSTADGPMALGAIMDQLDKEMQAAKEAPGQVRGQLRGAITGRGEGAAAPAPAMSFREGATATGPGGQRIVFRGGQWQPAQ